MKNKELHAIAQAAAKNIKTEEEKGVKYKKGVKYNIALYLLYSPPGVKFEPGVS